MTFTEAKEKILSALTQFPDELDVPKVASTDDFEICVGRLSKKPGEGTSQSKLEFEIIDGEKRMRDVYNKPWETGYLKFKNSDGASLQFVFVIPWAVYQGRYLSGLIPGVAF